MFSKVMGRLLQKCFAASMAGAAIYLDEKGEIADSFDPEEDED